MQAALHNDAGDLFDEIAISLGWSTGAKLPMIAEVLFEKQLAIVLKLSAKAVQNVTTLESFVREFSF